MLETITVYTLQVTGAGFSLWLMAESSKNIYMCLEYELLYVSGAEATYFTWK